MRFPILLSLECHMIPSLLPTATCFPNCFHGTMSNDAVPPPSYQIQLGVNLSENYLV